MKTILLSAPITLYMALILGFSGKVANGKEVCPFAHLKNGKTILRLSGQKAAFECKPGFQLLGSANSACVEGTWNPPIPACIKAGCDAIKTIRNGVILPYIYNGAAVPFRCDPGYFSRDFPVVYCDGSQWNSTKLACEANYTTSERQCDFETAVLCGWTHRDSDNDSYIWQRHSGATPSRIVGTGPLFDHTLGPGHEGHYMYIEASTGHTNDTALLYSPVYSPSLSRIFCVYFWYHMYGATTGSLKVYVKPEGVQLEHLQPLFLRDGHQEDAWLQGFFQTNITNKPFQVVFEGVHGRGYTSDIAIDDFRLVNNSCSAAETSNKFEIGQRAQLMNTASVKASRPWLAGVVVGTVMAVGLLLAAGVAVAVIIAKRRSVPVGGNWEASPNDAYVRYMSHEEALVQEDSDSSDLHDVL